MNTSRCCPSSRRPWTVSSRASVFGKYPLSQRFDTRLMPKIPASNQTPNCIKPNGALHSGAVGAGIGDARSRSSRVVRDCPVRAVSPARRRSWLARPCRETTGSNASPGSPWKPQTSGATGAWWLASRHPARPALERSRDARCGRPDVEALAVVALPSCIAPPRLRPATRRLRLRRQAQGALIAVAKSFAQAGCRARND